MSDQQPFTPFPFTGQPVPPSLPPTIADTKLPVEEVVPFKEKKKRGPKPGTKRVAKPARKGRKAPSKIGLAAPMKWAAEQPPQAPDLAVNFVMSVLIGLSLSEQQTVAMLVSLPDTSRERILGAVTKLTSHAAI